MNDEKMHFTYTAYLGVLLAGCSSDSTNAGGKQKVKVGIRNSELRTWEF